MERQGSDLCIVSDIADVRSYLGSSATAEYISEYLEKIFAKTFLLEEEYIDRDFIIDYSRFYSRSFSVNNKFTKRMHFFSAEFTLQEFSDALSKNDQDFLKNLQTTYLGFTVIKPIEDERGQPLIGRTLLKTFPDAVAEENRSYLKYPYSVSLFGIPLVIRSLPFQTQDKAVGACATVACWISTFPLSELFDTPKLSPYEVTEKSISFPVFNSRNFPSEGLNQYQIKNFYNSLGLDTECIWLVNENFKPVNGINEIFGDAVKAYISMGLPILATLRLLHPQWGSQFHAVIISGFRHVNGGISQIYVHDDQIGPYSRVTFRSDYSDWVNEWVNVHGATETRLLGLTIPIYPKIRLPFSRIFGYKKGYEQRRHELLAASEIPSSSSLSLHFTELRKYREYLLTADIQEKIEKLRKPFPRFLWIIRLENENIPLIDWVFDGTSVYAKIPPPPNPCAEPFETIIYPSAD